MKRMAEDARKWYERALRDLSTAEDLMRTKHYPDVCFYAQQIAEKALKAFLRANGIRIKGHDLVRLLRVAERYGFDTSDIDIDSVRELSRQYLAPRYPNFEEEAGIGPEYYTENLARSCLTVAADILRRVGSWLRSRGIID